MVSGRKASIRRDTATYDGADMLTVNATYPFRIEDDTWSISQQDAKQDLLRNRIQNGATMKIKRDLIRRRKEA